MTLVDAFGRIIIEPASLDITHGWAVLVLGAMDPGMIFARLGHAHAYAALHGLADPDIVAVVVSGEFIERV